MSETPLPTPSSSLRPIAHSATMQSQFDQHQTWCVSFSKRLTAMAEWFDNNHLTDAAVYAEINRLRYQLSSQQVMVAVVAEFSRGKSELINALFFAHYGRRIMPAGAGRTTMCPTEIGWNPALPISIRLLPIRTRTEAGSLAHWRVRPDAWVSFAFNPQEPDEMAQTIAKVSDVQRISVQEASQLGFWLPDTPDGKRHPDNPVPDRLGQVEVPLWRHACINIPHPLLQQGLVVLDTPGLNAVGVEPDLTMALLGQAQATLFVLSADTGVTKSDLDLWREHLSHAAAAHIPRYAILNKIDTLWDELKRPGEVEAELEKQCIDAAQLLSISRQSVIAVSAQKGLIAKIRRDKALLMRSKLPELESVLGGHLVRQRQSIIQQNCIGGIHRLYLLGKQALERRHREMSTQRASAQAALDAGAQSIEQQLTALHTQKQAVASAADALRQMQLSCIHGVNESLEQINAGALENAVQTIEKSLSSSLFKLGLRQAYEGAFKQLEANIQSAQQKLSALQERLLLGLQSMNTQHGFAIALMPAPTLDDLTRQLAALRASYMHHLDFGHSWRLINKTYLSSLLQTLRTQLAELFEPARTHITQWQNTTVEVFKTEFEAREHNLQNHIASLKTLRHSSTQAQAQLAFCDSQLQEISHQSKRLAALSKGLEEDLGEQPHGLSQGDPQGDHFQPQQA